MYLYLYEYQEQRVFEHLDGRGTILILIIVTLALDEIMKNCVKIYLKETRT